MAEALGEALLYLRTDDTGLNAGLQRAETGAERVGTAFDKTSASSGRLSQEMTSTGRAAGAVGAQFQQAGGQVIQSAAQQRQGMQQLGMQLGDMSTMYALGARPMQIFASQSGQVLQAVQMMTGGTSKLAAFLGGPWGIAVMVAAQVLLPLIGNLTDAGEAAALAEEGADGLAKAQSALGNVFDTVSGKLKTQNELLILNARLTALNLRAEAQQRRAGAESVFGTFDQGRTGLSASQKILGALGVDVSGGTGRDMAVRSLLREFQSGKITRQEALQRSASMNFDGLAVTRSQFQEAIIGQVVAQTNERAADLIDQSLDSGELAGEFRRPGRQRKPRAKRKPTGPTEAEIAERQAGEIARLGQEELRARQALATDIYERADLQRDALMQEREERIRQIKSDEQLGEQQKAAQIEYINRLYGNPESEQGQPGELIVSPTESLLGAGIMRELREREADMANDTIRQQIESLDAQADITTNLGRRNALEQRALQLQQQIERNLLDQDIANGRVAEADQARALLAEQQAAERQGLLRDQRGPLEQYRDTIRETAENMGTEIEQIEVQGLQNLNDGLADAIMGAKNLGDVFGNVADQIVRDLLRIALQRQLIEPLANMLMGGGGGGGGLLGSIFGAAIGLPGGGGGKALGNSFKGFFANGGLIPTGSFGIVGERGPEPVIGTAGGAMVLPNSSLRGGAMGGGSGPAAINITVSGARGNAEIEAMVRSGVQQGLAGYDRVVPDRIRDQQARYG